jgi:hypothetical protein
VPFVPCVSSPLIACHTDGSDNSSASISDIGSPALSSSSGCYFARDDASSRSSWSNADCVERAGAPSPSYERHSDTRHVESQRQRTPPLPQRQTPQPVSVLIPRTSTTSHARKKDPNHIPRPRNAFILFRSHAHRIGLVSKDVTSNHSNISVIISHMWRSLPEEEKAQWYQEAEREKEEHRQMYPDYKFNPVLRRTAVVRRNVRREEGDEERCLEIADQILKQYGREGIVRVADDPAAGSAAEQKAARRAATKAASRQKAAAIKAESPRKASKPRKAQARSHGSCTSSDGSPTRKMPRATMRRLASGSATSGSQSAPSAAETERAARPVPSSPMPTVEAEVRSEAVPSPKYAMPGFFAGRRRSISVPLLEPEARLAPGPWKTEDAPQMAHARDDDTVMADGLGHWQDRAHRTVDVPVDVDRDEAAAPRSPAALGHSTVRKGPPAPLALGAAEHRTSLSQAPMQVVAVQSPVERPRPRSAEGATPLSSTFRGAAVAGLHWHGLGGHEMLVSPMRATFGASRRPSVSGWQPWAARAVDVPSRGRGFSFTTDVSRAIEQQDDVLFGQAARMAAASMGGRYDESHLSLYDLYPYSPTIAHGGHGSIGAVASAPSSGLDSRAQPDFVEIERSPAAGASTASYTSSLDVADVAPGTGGARLRYHIDDEEMFTEGPRPPMPPAANQRRGNRPRSTSSAPPPESLMPAARSDGAVAWDVYSGLHVGRPIGADALDAAFSQLLNVPITPPSGNSPAGIHVTFAPLQQSAPAAPAPSVSPLALALADVHWEDTPSSPSARLAARRPSIRTCSSERYIPPSGR